MEEQILQILQKLNNMDIKMDGMQNQMDAMQIKTDTRFDQIQNQMDAMQIKTDTRFDQIQNQMDAMQIKTDTKFNQMQKQIDEIKNQIEEISDRQLVFEHEYGEKIDTIFDAVTMELDKNLEKSEKIRNLEKRIDRHDATMFSYEKRISKLELNR